MSSQTTALANVRTVIIGGDGLVVRAAGLLLVVPELVPDAMTPVQRLLEICTEHADGQARTLLRRVAYLLGEPELSGTPAFAILLSTGTSSAHLFAQGSVDARLPDGSRLSSSQSFTWIEQELTELEGLVLTGSGSDIDDGDWAAPVINLEKGIVRGAGVRLEPLGKGHHHEPEPRRQHAPDRPSGFSLHHSVGVVPRAEEGAVGPISTSRSARAAPAPADQPTAPHRVVAAPVASDRSPVFEAVLLTDQSPERSASPLPPVRDDPLPDESVLVEGIVCSRGHFNDPDSAYCTVCGISMAQRSQEFVSAPRPPLGVLIFDDGTAFTVDGDYVVGREPEVDPDVVAGRARPLSLNDVDNAVSRVHAALRLDGWQVRLEDRGSSNGTFVAGTGDHDWRRLHTGEPTVLTAGQRVRFGHRVAVYESHVGQRW